MTAKRRPPSGPQGGDGDCLRGRDARLERTAKRHRAARVRAPGGARDAVIAVAQAATERSVSFCIPEDQLADTVRFLHRELGLEDGQQHRARRGARSTEQDQ
ncbi:MAG: hypothetical protein PVG71_12145 [Anaerolineae bacterium]